MSPYREPMTAPARPLPVLLEEYNEATSDVEGWLTGASLTAFGGALAAAIGVGDSTAATLPFVGVLWGATVLCLVGYYRCRRTIRRWRDQERRRIAEGAK